MKKIFYWSPYLSNVATIRNVIDSAFSLAKYSKGSYKPYIIDAMGEWSNKNNEIYVLVLKFKIKNKLMNNNHYLININTVFNIKMQSLQIIIKICLFNHANL